MALLEFGELGQPGGLVDRVADHRVLKPGLRSDVSGDRPPGRDTDSEVDLVERAGQLVVQLPGGRQRGACGVGMLQWRAEDTQGGVTLELVHEPAVALHDVDDDPEEIVEYADHLARRSGGGQLRRTDKVDEQHRDITFLTAQFGAALQRAAGDVLADVAPEQVAQAFAFAEFADHVVEAGLQQAQFGRVVDLHVGVVVPALDLAERPAQLTQRVGDRHRGEDVAGQADQQCRDGHQQDRREQAVGGNLQQGELSGDDGQHDHQQRHTGGQRPGQQQAQHDAGAPETHRRSAAQRGHRHRPQHPLGL